jgi:hypothetical protein|tara:strand:- start:25 stop:573 length:549 start_codon:yes stop_codon:yes gene_type:complete
MKKIIIESKTHGRHEVLVDDEDYDHLNEHKWHVHKTIEGTFYAVRKSPIDSNGKQSSIFIHRGITNAPKGMVVDHINGNPLDNRKENLRVCTTAENCRNRGKSKNNKSGYKGVSYHKKAKHMINEYKSPWQSMIVFNRKLMCLGMYKTKEEAARAYDQKAIELFGEFALLNFPEEQQCLTKY